MNDEATAEGMTYIQHLLDNPPPRERPPQTVAWGDFAAEGREWVPTESVIARWAREKPSEEEMAYILHILDHAPRVTSPPIPTEGSIPYTELPEADPRSPLAEEWNTYRREVGRLLAEGHEGHIVLIKGSAIIGFYKTQDEATQAGWERFLNTGFLVHTIRAEEPLLRTKGYWHLCRKSPILFPNPD